MKSGFSLVELSIVLVILGLLTGGILSGQSLIRAAELRSVGSEYARYASAAHSFRDKYMAIPGDMRTATRFWSKDNAACPGQSGTAGSPGVCNGDGDGIMENATAAGATGETFQFWKHLALSGLIEGSYSGLAGSASVYGSHLGVNVPASKLTNAGWSAYYINPGGDTARYAVEYGNHFAFGGRFTNTITEVEILRPEEAWNIDVKLDDGKPAYGKVIARYWNDLCGKANSGASTKDNLDASYNIADGGALCALYFVRAF